MNKIPRSSHKFREAWAEFAIQLQDKSIVDHADVVQCKRVVFEKLYNESDPRLTDIHLVVSGLHPMFSLVDRPGMKQAIDEQAQIQNATKAVMNDLAMAVLRHHPPIECLPTVLKLMVEAMMAVHENGRDVEDRIRKKLSEV